MARRIFINYRRDDASPTAGRLLDRLVRVFGKRNVFMDVENIPPGAPWDVYIKKQIARYDTFLVIIGSTWIDAKDQTGRRRIDNPDDPVVMEITTALSRKRRVIPVTIDGARMPTSDELPGPLKPLAHRNAIDVRNNRFTDDFQSLIKKIGKDHRGRTAGLLLFALVVAGGGFYLKWVFTPEPKWVFTPAAPPAETTPADREPEKPGQDNPVPENPGPNAPKLLQNYAVRTNRDLYGDDIRQPDGGLSIGCLDVKLCAASCDMNLSCVAFSFDRWNGRCFLKKRIPTKTLLDPHSTIGVKAPGKIPEASQSPFKMIWFYGHRFRGTISTRKAVSGFNACKAGCADDINCVAFNFLKTSETAENCEFFKESEEGHFSDSSVDSGYKIQPSPQLSQ
jgi:hypothetical protein